MDGLARFARGGGRTLNPRSSTLALALTFAGVAAGAADGDRLPSQYAIRTWRTEDGLPSGTVTRLVQDADGYVWLATPAGPVRFDGSRFVGYRPGVTPGLAEGGVTSLALDSAGALWMGTATGWLTRVAGGTFDKRDASTANNGIQDLSAGRDGSLWVASLAGIVRLGPDGAIAEQHLRNDYQCLLEDRKGALFIGTRGGGLLKREGKSTTTLGRAEGLPSATVQALHEDARGTLWIGTSLGLARLAGGRAEAVHAGGLAGASVTALASDARGSLWVGTATGGLYRLRDGRVAGLRRSDGLADDDVRSLLVDRESNVWVGTADGLTRLGECAFATFGRQEGIPDPRVRAVGAARAGGVWLGTDSGRVYRVTDSVEPVPIAGLPAEAILALHEERDGTLWIATDESHLYRVRDGRAVEATPAVVGKVSLLYEDAGGLVIAAGRAGVGRLAGRRFVPLYPSAAAPDYVFCAHTDREGTLWLGTTAGLAQLRGGRQRLITTAEGLPSNRVRWIHSDPDGTLWVASQGGLSRLRPGQGVRTVRIEQGLPENFVRAFHDDGRGSFWLASMGFVFRLARAELEAVLDGRQSTLEPRVFDAGDGLRSTEVKIGSYPLAATADGRLWFATARGVSVVDPERGQLPLPPPPLRVEELTVDGRRVAGARFPPGAGNVEVAWTALTFRAPERVLFRYWLEGADDAWVEAGGARQARYLKLPPGRYVFKLSARATDSSFAPRELSLPFEVARHWYQTWWARALATLALAGLGFAAYFLRVASFRRTERVLAERVEMRTADLQREVAEHRRTEARLQAENEERERAEQEARAFGVRLAASNEDLVEQRRALERENQERRAAEEAAARERDLLRALMDNIPDLIYFKDAELRYTRVNRAHAAALSLRDPGDAVGRPEADFVPAAQARASGEDERELLRSGVPVLGKLEHHEASGRWFLVSKVPIRDERGRAVGLVGIARDISERRQAEEALERDLRALLAAVDEMARGDLTRRGAEGPEVLGRIARGLNAMIDGFSGILADARETAVSVSATASQLLASSMQIAHGAEEGSQQVNQVSSAVEQMAASMAQVSRHAEATAGSARKVLEQVRLGDASAQAASEGMARIDGSVESAAGRVRALEERSRQVFDVIDLIEEIAAQSNLLSLNAAIEAAHAGDAGRGFGVVADEIRRLADSSRESTAEAARILDGLVEEMRSVLVAMAEVQEGVAAGRTHSAAARGSLDEIAALVQDSVRRTEEISVAAREQAQATRVVARAVQSIALISQQSSQSARESAQAIGGLVAFAEQLAGTIARFRTGGTARAPAEPARQATTLAPETSRSPAAAPSLR